MWSVRLSKFKTLQCGFMPNSLGQKSFCLVVLLKHIIVVKELSTMTVGHFNRLDNVLGLKNGLFYKF